MIAIFVWVMIFAIFIVPIYYGIRESVKRQKRYRGLRMLKEFTLLQRVGMRETANIIVDGAYMR